MRRFPILAAFLGFLACGCQDDWDRLKVIGQKLANRAPNAPQVKEVDWREAGDMIRSSLTESPAVYRVKMRLRFEKDLAQTSIRVVNKGAGRIELTGTVSSENQRVRAADIASRTAGVEEVVNSLTLSAQENGVDNPAVEGKKPEATADEGEKKPPV